MPSFSKRSTMPEIMDDLLYAGPLMDKTLKELEIINRWLGGNAVTIGALATLLRNHNEGTIIHIADLGCGRGDMLQLIKSWAERNKYKVRLTGIDANPYIIDAARKNLLRDPEVELQAVNIFSEEFQQRKFDIVIGTLFYHHFTDDELVLLFSKLKQQVAIGFIINDIHRHPLAYYSIKLLTWLFSKSSMVKFDAPLSVLRAFTKRELSEILRRSKLYSPSIKWKWAFRWQILIHCGQRE